jgi:hypothetical protein
MSAALNASIAICPALRAGFRSFEPKPYTVCYSVCQHLLAFNRIEGDRL